MRKVLIIEDDVNVIENLQDILEQQDYQTITATDSSLGILLSQKEEPDLILCDVMMPNLDGYGVLQAVRQHQLTETIPLIFVTGKTERAAVQRGIQLGADAYIGKPFTTDELLNTVETCLRRPEQHLGQTSRQNNPKSVNQLAQDYREIAEASTSILKMLSEDLRHPFSNIKIALHMARETQSQVERDFFLNILEEECIRGSAFLNDALAMQEFLTPQKFNVLRQLKSLNQSEQKEYGK